MENNKKDIVIPENLELVIESRILDYNTFTQALENMVDDGTEDYKRRYKLVEDEVFKAHNAIAYYCHKYGLDIKKYINK